MTHTLFRNFPRRSSTSAPASRLARAARSRLFRALAPEWTGTKQSLKRAVASALKPFRKNLALLARILRDARFAELLAGALLICGAMPVSASPPIELTDVAAGIGGFVINGEAEDDESGHGLSGAGDVNGDGLADLIIGARYANVGGRSYVIFGRSATDPVGLSAISAGAGGIRIDAEMAGDRAGRAVSRAADVNGDALDDILIGAWGFGPNGRSYVVFGRANSNPVALSTLSAGIGGGFGINGEAEDDSSGWSVSGAGDVNGDGFADLIIGAHDADPHGSFSGRSYVVFGRTGKSLVGLSDVSAGIGGFSISGEFAGDYAGQSVSGMGDVNGDGLADLLVGALYADPNGEASGRGYVVFGKAGTEPVELSAIAAGVGGFAISGESADDRSSVVVSSAGDVNGDALADVLVWAPLADPNGRGYVVFGKPGTVPVELSSITSGAGGGFAIDGEAIAYSSLWGASGAGDINGDGLADLIIGASGANPNGAGSGRTYVVFGKTDSSVLELSEVASGTGGFVIHGEAPNDRAGFMVSATGDVNGDGLADLMVAAPQADPNGDASGRSYVIFSPEAPPPSAIYLARSRAGDGTAGAPVVPSVVPDVLYDARTKIDYSDDDYGSGSGLNGSSLETVTLTRNDVGISNLSIPAEVANVMWEISTDRTGWASAAVTFKYTNAEIYGLDETSLRIFQAPSPAGPWTELSTTRAPQRNEVRATVTSFGFFALEGDPGSGIPRELFDRYE